MDTFELRVVDPATGLPTWPLGDVETWSVAPVISDAGTVQFTYPKNGINASQVIMDRDVAIFYNGVEIGSLRSTMEQQSWNDVDVAEEGTIAQITCRTSMARMERAIVYPQLWPTNSNPPSYTFTTDTPGFILRTLVQTAQLRGTIPEIDISSFSDTHDSAGQPWATSISINWSAQTTYLQVVQDLQTYGQCDAVMDVYSLKLYNYQTVGVDRTTQNPPVIIRKGRDLIQSSVQESTRSLSTVVLASGSNNLYTESEYGPGVISRGRREVGTSASGVTNVLQLKSIGDAWAESVAIDAIARTNALAFGDPDSPVPSIDFDLGDWVWTSIDGTRYRQRVLQYSVSMANDGSLSGTTALDNIFGEFLTRLQAQVDAIENGSTITGGSEPDKVDLINVAPAIPTGVSAGTVAYLDNQGNTLSSLTIAWAAVTEDADGAADTNIAGYQVAITLHGATDWTIYPCPESVTSFYAGGLNPNVSYDYKVQCYDTQANYSGWSSVHTITTASDTTGPNEPSTPVVTSTLGQLSITWDGLDDLGGTMPGDFDHLSVYVSSLSPTFTPSPDNLYQNVSGGGTVTVPGAVLTYGTTYYARFVAYDKTGNASPASAAGSDTLSQVVATDIATGQVSISNLAFSDVGNLINNGSFEDPNWRTTYNTLFGGSHFGFDNTTSSGGNWSVTHFGTAGQTNENINLSSVSCTPGQTFMGAADWKVSTAVTSTMRVAVGVNFFDVSGTNLGYSDLSYCQTAPSTNDNTWRSRIATQAAVAPAGTVKATFVFASHIHTAGQVWCDNVEVRMQQDNLLIANAAITDAKIGTVSANKIIAGTMSAGVIISGSIGTGASGQRCVMDGTGFHAYDSSGNMVFDVNNFAQQITLGAIGGVGKVVIDTNPSDIYPQIRFYDLVNTNYAFILTSSLNGCSAGLAMSSGTYQPGSTLLANRVTMDGNGAHMQVIDATVGHGNVIMGGDVFVSTSVANMRVMTSGTQDGGLVSLGKTSSLFGLFVNGATHGGQFIFNYDATNSDAQWELDGYLPNWHGAATQFGIITGDIGGFAATSGGVSVGFNTTPYSTMIPVAQYSCSSLGQTGGNINALTSTGFAFTLSAGSPGTWSIFFWAWRVR